VFYIAYLCIRNTQPREVGGGSQHVASEAMCLGGAKRGLSQFVDIMALRCACSLRLRTLAALAAWGFHERLVMSQSFGRNVMGELPISARVSLPELEAEAAVTRMKSERLTMTAERVIPFSFPKVSGLAHRGPKRPKAAESQQFDEDRLRSIYLCGSATLILGRYCSDGRQFRSDTCVKGPEEIVQEALLTRRTAASGARHHSSMALSERHAWQLLVPKIFGTRKDAATTTRCTAEARR
jgi:hypothetical protein